MLTPNSSFGRGLWAAGHLTELLVRRPRKAVRLLRSLGAQVLDNQFQERSPLPVLPERILKVLGEEDIALPRAGLSRWGNQDLMGLRHLAALAKTLDAGVAFEIGTFTGLTALTLAVNLPEAVIHTLDLPTGTKPVLPLTSTDYPYLTDFEDRVYNGHKAWNRIVQHFGDSARFDFSPFYGTCQLVYIDGSHSFDYVANDSSVAFKMVSSRAVIVWDDYWHRVSGVARYLHSRRDLPLFRLPESRLAIWMSSEAFAHLAPGGHKPASESRPPSPAPLSSY